METLGAGIARFIYFLISHNDCRANWKLLLFQLQNYDFFVCKLAIKQKRAEIWPKAADMLTTRIMFYFASRPLCKSHMELTKWNHSQKHIRYCVHMQNNPGTNSRYYYDDQDSGQRVIKFVKREKLKVRILDDVFQLYKYWKLIEDSHYRLMILLCNVRFPPSDFSRRIRYF